MSPEAETFLSRNASLIREAFRDMERENARFDLDLESACVDVEREADYISCADPEQIALHVTSLIAARDFLNRAITKASCRRAAA